jgi:hypothetical protein
MSVMGFCFGPRTASCAEQTVCVSWRQGGRAGGSGNRSNTEGKCHELEKICGRLSGRGLVGLGDHVVRIGSVRCRLDSAESAAGTASAAATVGHSRVLRRHLRERLHHAARVAGHQYRPDHADRQRTDVRPLQEPEWFDQQFQRHCRHLQRPVEPAEFCDGRGECCNAGRFDAVGSWNEFDWWVSADWTIGKYWKTGVTYITFLSPPGAFRQERNVEPYIRFDDGALTGWAFTINAYAKLFYAISGDSTVVVGNQGNTYDVEIGMVPTVDLKKITGTPLTIAAPTWVTVGPSSYWNRGVTGCGATTTIEPCSLSNAGVFTTGLALKETLDWLSRRGGVTGTGRVASSTTTSSTTASCSRRPSPALRAPIQTLTATYGLVMRA